MRRESTFSVLAIPDDLARSGLDPEGHRRGLERKKLFEQWIERGRLDLILNAEPSYAEKERGYSPRDILIRLEELRSFVENHVSSPGFAIAIRSHPIRRDSYASLGDEVLFITENKKKVKHRTQVFRDRIAVNVFNRLFDQEMDAYAHSAEASIRTRKGRAPAQRQALANRAALRQIERFIESVRGR